MPTKNVEALMGLEKHHLKAIGIIIISNKKYQWIVKLVGESEMKLEF